MPRAEIDARVGGHYTIVMRDEEGIDYEGRGEYRDVVEPERIVFTDSIDAMPRQWIDVVNEARGAAPGTRVPDGLVTVTMEHEGGRCKMTFSEEFDSKATRDAFIEVQMVEGFEGSLDNLERVLAGLRSAAR